MRIEKRKKKSNNLSMVGAGRGSGSMSWALKKNYVALQGGGGLKARLIYWGELH